MAAARLPSCYAMARQALAAAASSASVSSSPMDGTLDMRRIVLPRAWRFHAVIGACECCMPSIMRGEARALAPLAWLPSHP